MRPKAAVWLLCAALLPGALAPAAQAGTTAQEVEEDNSLATAFVTPHKKWARGTAAGLVRALFFVNAVSGDGTWYPVDTLLREVVELQQRFDVQGDAVLVGGAREADFLGQDLGRQRAERLLAKPYDAYVFAGFPLEKLPPKHQYLVLEQVAKGAGLVCCGPAPQEYLQEKRRLNPLPAALAAGLPALDGKPAATLLTAYRLREGRAVWLNYDAWALTPRRDFSWRALAEYDYRMLLVGRALLWATSHEGDVSLTWPPSTSATQPPNHPTTQPPLVLTSRSKNALPLRVSLELRRASDGWPLPLGERAVVLKPGGQARVPVRLPRLRAGDYFVDAVARSRRGVEAFGAGALTVTSDYGVESVALGRSFVERGRPITGTVALRGAVPARSTLRLRFRDSYSRVLAQRDLPVRPGQSQLAFSYTPDAFATILMRVEGALLTAGQEVEMQSASFTVPKRRRGQFNFLQWDTPRDVLGYYAWRKLQEAGMGVCLLGSFEEAKPVPVLQACDISLVPYSTRILDPKDDNGIMKPSCWDDEPNIAPYVQKIVDNQKAHREHGVFVYSLGDEGVTQGCCLHPADMASYRRYLAERYGTVERLNASWGSGYASFDEVALVDGRNGMESGAAAQGLYARWFDREAYARSNLVGFSGRFVQAYKQLDPKALTGFEGTGGFGDDFDAILATNTFYSPYPGIGDDIIRSAAPRSLIRANWMGYSKTGDALSDAAWRMVMKGMDSVWYWMWTGVGNWRGYLSPRLDFWPATADVTREMSPVRRGLGDLLLHARMLHSGIAVFYSVPSALSANVENGREYVQPEATHRTWTQLTYDLGLDYRYVTPAMLKRGALTPREFRVLLLPMAQAISPAEAQAIREYVRAGGIVVSDVRPGIHDGHCKPAQPGMLDDVFGITRTGRGNPVRAPVAIDAPFGGRRLGLKLALARIDPGVRPEGAKSLARAGEAPLLLVNSFGKGRAVLLNFQLLSEKQDAAQAAATRRFLAALYAGAGAKAAVSAADPRGGPLPFTETRVWSTGDALIFGLWRQMQCEWFSPTGNTTAGPPVPARITLPAPRHVYDLRAGRYLGRVSRIDTRLRWGRASFFLALPYPIEGVKLSLSATAPPRGRVVEAQIRLAVPRGAREQHAAWVDVLDPQGRPALWGGQVVLLQGGAGRVRVPVAYNDAPGRWRLRATELFSGKRAEASWVVR